MTADGTHDSVKESVERLFQWILSQNYIGWDIYDGLNSPLLSDVRNPYIRILILQANKYSPINFRPLLRVEKGVDVKGMALFAHAYALLYKSTLEERYFTEMQKNKKGANNFARPLMIFIEIRFVISLQIVLFL